jgi:hypothetical protein
MHNGADSSERRGNFQLRWHDFQREAGTETAADRYGDTYLTTLLQLARLKRIELFKRIIRKSEYGLRRE